MGGLGGDAVAVVGALANKPEDVAISSGHHQLTALFQKRQLAVGKKVTHKLMSFHSKGAKCIARLH